MSLIFQVLTIWTNPASQAQLFASFLLCLLEFPPAKCCGAISQGSPTFSHVLQQVLCKHKAWPFLWGERAKSGCKDSVQSKERWPGMFADNWVTGSLMSGGVRLPVPRGQGPLLSGSLAHLLVWCWAHSRCSGISVG